VEPWTVVLASVLAAGLLATIGSLTDLCLGDENPHVRCVREYIRCKERVPYDPLFEQERLKPVAFMGTPLWHAGLAILWGLSGSEYQPVAQAYQAGFYLLLVLSVYFGVRHHFGQSAAGWAWLLVASMPMVGVYSVLLYQDVPGVAVAALAFWLLWRRKFLWAGVAFGAAYLTKMNMLSFAPWAVVFAAWWANGSWKRRLGSAALVAAPVLVALLYDFAWRFQVYDASKGILGLMGRRLVDVPSAVQEIMSKAASDQRAWRPFAAENPTSIVSHFGIPALVGVVLALARFRDRRAWWLWGCLAIALLGFFVVFVPTGCTQVRYLFPVALVVALLAGFGLGSFRLPRWLAWLAVAACLIQSAAALAYVSSARHISDCDAEAYAWIRANTPPDARLMCPEEAVTNQTGRPFLWYLLNPAYLMTEATDAERHTMFSYFGVTHVAIPLRRVYDRRKEGAHAGGYEKHFVEQASTLPYLERVFANEGFIIYKYRPQDGDAPQATIPRPAPTPAAGVP